MWKRINDMGINQKFMLSLLLLLLIPMIVLLLLVDVIITKEIDDRTYETNYAQLKQTKNGIQTYTDALQLLSLNLATDQDIQDLILLYNNNASIEQKTRKLTQVQYRVNMELSEYEQVTAVSIFNADSVVYWYGNYVLEEDLQFVPQMDALAGRPMWTGSNDGVYYAYRKAGRNIYLMRAIRNLNTFETIAYERLSIDEASLRAQYETLVEESGVIFVIEPDGTIISSTDPALLGSTYSSLTYPELKTKEGYQVQKDLVTSWYTHEDTGWKIVKIDSAAWLCRNNNLYSVMILICIMMAVVFGFVFILIQQKTLIKPVTKLSHAVKKFDKASFEIPIYTDSADEIGELNRNLSGMMQYIQKLILDQYELQIRRREIELKYMQSQINPHFLYNTLDSIRWMAVLEKQDAIAEQIEALADVFRHALSRGKDVVTLAEEVEHLRNYIMIQKKRFSDRLDFDISVQENLKDCQVLKLILQPLVENAIVHGLENKPEGGTVWIRVCTEDDTLCYCVEDDGLGMDMSNESALPNNAGSRYNGFALRNIEERIKMKYGERFGITFSSTPGKGTRVEVHLPIVLELSE